MIAHTDGLAKRIRVMSSSLPRAQTLQIDLETTAAATKAVNEDLAKRRSLLNEAELEIAKREEACALQVTTLDSSSTCIAAQQQV